MTSNIGSQTIMDKLLNKEENKDKELVNTLKEELMPELRQVFKPEFLNRLDEITAFNPMSKAMLAKIAEIEVNKYVKIAAQEKYIEIKYSQDLLPYLAEK